MSIVGPRAIGTIEVVEDQAVAWVACDRLFPKIMSDEIETV